MNANPVQLMIADELGPLEARAAFLAAAVGAIASLNDESRGAYVGRQALEGLCYWTQDLETMLRKLNELAEGKPCKGEGA